MEWIAALGRFALDILRSLGYSDSDIVDLRAAAVIG